MFSLFNITSYSAHKKHSLFAFLFLFSHAEIIEHQYLFDTSRQELVKTNNIPELPEKALSIFDTPQCVVKKAYIQAYTIENPKHPFDTKKHESVDFLKTNLQYIRSVVISLNNEQLKPLFQSILECYLENGLDRAKCMLITLGEDQEKNNVEIIFFLAV